jgi:hypothetical protein
MKTTMKILIAFMFVLATALAGHAQLLFSDDFNYPNGCVETDGVWFCYSPETPGSNTFVNNNLVIFNQASGQDSVAAPFTNDSGNTLVFASFTIKASQLPTSVNGSYFAVLMQASNNVDVADVAHVFIDTKNAAVPGTYRLGIANFATALSTALTTNYPMDLATGITYQVVFSYDPNNSDPLYGATLWINPSSLTDANVYANDTGGSTAQVNIGTNISAIGFSPYASAAIGDVMVGLNFTDVMTNTAQLPVIGVKPVGASLYSGDNLTLYSAASGMDVSYQWLSNSVPLIDDGVTVVGSQSNILNLTNLQASANYSVVVSDSAGSVTSAVAVVSVDTTPTPPFFTIQPQSQTNSLGGTITLASSASGTGPISYQWYYAPSNSVVYTALSGQTSPTLTLSSVTFNTSGSYYVTATGDGSQNSATATVLVVPPATVTIGYLHTLETANATPTTTNLNNGTIYNVQGVVASYGAELSSKYSEYFIQDGTGGAIVFINGVGGSTNVPPIGSLVSITGVAQQYYGELELVPNVTNSINQVTILSTNNPVNVFALVNIPSIAPALGTYGLRLQCSIVTMTNVYLYASATGTPVSGNFPTSGSKTLYAFQQPYTTGAPYVEVYVTTYTNAVNQLNTNFFGQPIPSFCSQLTGGLSYYNVNTPEVSPTRFADFVTAPPSPFPANVTLTNGTTTISWPVSTGSTYSVYSATNVSGPWTQTFGLGYFPSTGVYVDTNAAAAKFYRVSTP